MSGKEASSAVMGFLLFFQLKRKRSIFAEDLLKWIGYTDESGIAFAGVALILLAGWLDF